MITTLISDKTRVCLQVPDLSFVGKCTKQPPEARGVLHHTKRVETCVVKLEGSPYYCQASQYIYTIDNTSPYKKPLNYYSVLQVLLFVGLVVRFGQLLSITCQFTFFNWGTIDFHGSKDYANIANIPHATTKLSYYCFY